MKHIKHIIYCLILSITSYITANSYEVDYKKYRNIPTDSTLTQLIDLISQNEIARADSLYFYTLDQLEIQDNYTLYLFYANEYSYSRYTHNTIHKETAHQLLDSALKVAKPHLANDDFELFLGEYNMNFYSEDKDTRIKWIKAGLSHLDFDKYDFAKPIYNSIASLHYANNNYDSAWYYWDIVKRDTSLDQRFIANLYKTIGAKTATFDTEMAVDFIKEAMRLSQDTIDAIEDITSNAILTKLYTQIGDYKKSIEHGIATIRQLEQHQDLHNIQTLTNHNIWVHVIESYISLSDTKNARYWTEDMKRKANSFRSSAIASIRIDWLYGMILNAEQKYDSAQYYYDRSNQGFLNYTKDSLSNYLCNGYYYKGNCYLNALQIENAIDNYKKSIIAFNHKEYNSINENLKSIAPQKIFKPYLIYNIDMILDLLNAHVMDHQLNHNETSLYEIMRLSRYCNRLIKYRFRGVATPESALETSAYLKRCCGYGIYASYELSKAQEHYLDSAFILADMPRSFTLNYNKELSHTSNNTAQDSIMQQITRLNIEIANAKQSKLNTEELFELKYQLYRSKSILTRTQIKDFSFMDNSKCYQNVISQLRPEDAVLQITCLGDSCYIICLTKEGQTMQLCHLKDLSNITKKLTRAIKTNGDWQQASSPLYNAFIAPFQAQLNGKKKLTLYTDERLHNIPFSLLSDQQQTPLVQHYAITYHNSAKAYSPQTIQPHNILIMAPGFEKQNTIATQTMLRSSTNNTNVFRSSGNKTTLSPLPHSITEAKAINSTFRKKNINSQLITGSRASKQYFINHTHEYDILHLATHGIATNQYQTGLFFSPNPHSNNASFMSTNELYKQKLKAQLVVLSACQSGLGEMATGEGIIGLPRSFMYAGTHNVIASLWKIHDAKTQTLMIAFYNHLIHDACTYAEALQRAKLDCIKQGYLAMDWADFILISE